MKAYHLHKLLFVLTAFSFANIIMGETTAVNKSKANGVSGILFNEDCSNPFVLDPPGKMNPERLDRIVDELADSHVTVMLINVNSQKTIFKSKSWESYGDGSSKWARNLRVLFDAGIDPPARMIDRCRQRGISPWISIRMNDVHSAFKPDPSIHSRFWREHPQYWRYPNRKKEWTDRCLNYGLKPVRDHIMALIKEVCNRYDIDGLELDWNRFPAYFCPGEEIQQGKVLTKWMAEVRQVVKAAEKKWGHSIKLAARVPARPEVAVGIGLDAVTWARCKLIDHLIVAPFFATTDFDIPVERWIRLLKGTGIGVTAGLDVQIRTYPYPHGVLIPNTSEYRRGAAMSVLSRGSQGIYVFNYFANCRKPYLFDELKSISVEGLKGKDRSYAVTFVDINVPGKVIPPALPKKLATGKSGEFSLFIGPKPISGARGEIRLGFIDRKAQERCNVQVKINGRPTAASETANVFTFEGSGFRKGYNTIMVKNMEPSNIIINRVEMSVRF